MVTFTVRAEKEERRAVFRGQVIEISAKFITIERTSIALPKKIKTLDGSGASIPTGTIKKGDYVIVTIEKNEATIQRTGRTRTEGNEKLFTQ
jgi:small-conductance mechanosensitive channel